MIVEETLFMGGGLATVVEQGGGEEFEDRGEVPMVGIGEVHVLDVDRLVFRIVVFHFDVVVIIFFLLRHLALGICWKS